MHQTYHHDHHSHHHKLHKHLWKEFNDLARHVASHEQHMTWHNIECLSELASILNHYDHFEEEYGFASDHTHTVGHTTSTIKG